MHAGKLVFAQLTEHLPLTTFRRCVAAYGGETVILSLEASRSTSEIVAAIRAGQPVR